MACTNCFNGCDDIQSDQCIKYTGISFPDFNISYGDNYNSVTTNILESLTNINSGESILPDFQTDGICTFVTDFMPVNPEDRNLNKVLQAYMESLCSLNTSVEDINTELDNLNIPYTLNCLDPETQNNTHSVLQASLNKICILEDDLTALQLDVQTNYVRVDQIDEYIQDYIDNSGTSSLMSNKMVPYVVYEYHGPLSYFDLSGAGTGDWLKIYLCNGQNGTPDKRGVVSVGATTGMSGGPFNPIVDPALPGNPAYSLGSITGTNTVGITTAQMPSHTHTGSTGVAGAHSHTLTFSPGGADADPGADFVKTAVGSTFTTDTAGAHSHTITIDPIGGGQPHPNVQPGMGVYYIQYRP